MSGANRDCHQLSIAGIGNASFNGRIPVRVIGVVSGARHHHHSRVD